MKIARFFLTILCLTSVSAFAATRTSLNYSLTTETADLGGGRATSISYTEDGSSDVSGGISTVASPIERARVSYAGQLYEVTGLTANIASPSMVTAWKVLDDGSQIAVPATVHGFEADGLTLGTLTLGFAPTPGQMFTLVHATSPIAGMFANLPQGSIVNASYNGTNYSFTLNYSGGTGDNITLTSTATVPAMPAWGALLLGGLLLGLAMMSIHPTAGVLS